MKETIKALINLKDIDEKLGHLNNRIKDGPRILEKRKLEYQDAQAAVQRKRDAILAFKLSSKDKEVELQSVEAEIRKQDTHLLGAKTNQEYSAIQDQIKRLREKVGKLEEAILVAYEGVEEDTKDLAALERELKAQEAELDDFRHNIENEMGEYAREIEEWKAKREELLYKLDFKAVNLYEKVKKARDGDAIVCADGQMCYGCYMTITANDMARLRGINEIVLCKSCQRILYLSDMLD
ncbi:MAG: C4-type zinc ribbon domain-containing protein [Planctomycetota bacterium]